MLDHIFIQGMAGEEERTVEERDAPQGPKDEMISVMYVWSGCVVRLSQRGEGR